MPRHRPLTALAAAAALALAACGPAAPGGTGTPAPSASAAASGQPSVYPTVVSSQLGIGANRFVFAFLDPATGGPVADPARTASVRFVPPGSQTAGEPVEGTFTWAIEGTSGVYVAAADFPAAGEWLALFTTAAPGGPAETIAFRFDVLDDPQMVRAGERAPRVATPTLADAGGDVRRISSDTDPLPRFYERSLDDVLAAGEPVLVAFATPAFCTSATCGPVLEVVKGVVAGHPDLAVVNVEPYRLAWTGERLQPELTADGYLQAAPAAAAFGLPTEPWVYVIGRDGLVVAAFEGTVGAAELEAAIAAAG